MSQVLPIPAGAVAGLITILILAEVGAPELVVGAVGALVACGVTLAWAMSDRLSNGTGP